MVDFSDSLKNAFNKWDARIFLLVSLLLQVLLILIAPRRKRSISKALTFLTWSSYLLADWVAGFTLGLLVQSQGGSNCHAAAAEGNIIHDDGPIISSSKHKVCHNYNDNLLAFWAPFLLLHLGGPDNITAFSMEDNSLWPRHLVGLLFQVGTALYVLLLSLPQNRLLAPTILIFLVGTIKYLERTFALYMASLDAFRESFLWRKRTRVNLLDPRLGENWNYNMVLFAYYLLGYYKGIIVDQCSSVSLRSIAFCKLKAADAFKLIEWELSFAYDLLFTKVALMHTYVGYALRLLCSSLILAASALFFLSSKLDFTRLDVCITYVLLAGAISLDILAYIMLIFSKWTIVSLKDFESRFEQSKPLTKIVSPIIFRVVSRSNEWSGSMMQHNLMNSCLEHQTRIHFHHCIMRRSFVFDMKKLFDHYQTKSTWSEDITDDFRDFILQNIQNKFANCDEGYDVGRAQKMLLSRGNLPLEDKDEEVFRESVEVRFEKSILTWHIATDLCYYTEDKAAATDPRHQNLSRLVSNYMVYLLCKRLHMIPHVANWEGIYRDTCRRVIDELKSQQLEEACNHFLLHELGIVQDGYSVFHKAVALAKKIKELQDGERWSKVAEVWADMLLYAANNCPGLALAQSLSRGGELLTSVCFLLHHYRLGRYVPDANDFLTM